MRSVLLVALNANAAEALAGLPDDADLMRVTENGVEIAKVARDGTVTLREGVSAEQALRTAAVVWASCSKHLLPGLKPSAEASVYEEVA